MKKFAHLDRWPIYALAALVLMLILAIAVPGRAQDGKVAIAKAIRVKGEARYSSDGRTWQKLKAGQALCPGAYVQTAKTGGSADIQFGEPVRGGTVAGSDNSRSKQAAGANMISLLEDSVVVLTKLTAKGTGADYAEETELDLRAGRVLGVIRNYSSSSKFEVSFPSGVSGMVGEVEDSHGTVFVLGGSGNLKVLSGKFALAIASENTTAQVVRGGQQFDPATGKISDLPADAPERKLWPR